MAIKCILKTSVMSRDDDASTSVKEEIVGSSRFMCLYVCRVRACLRAVEVF